MKGSLTHTTRGNVVELAELAEQERVFRDRQHAGRILAEMLERLRGGPTLLLAIPAGGMPVAVAMAVELEVDLDVAVVSKVTLPWNTEAGYGAVAFDGTVLLNEPMIRTLPLSEQDVAEGIARTREKVARRLERLRGNRGAPSLEDRSVVVVDDGLASGYTCLVAVAACRFAGARHVSVAVPTAHRSSAEWVARDVDHLTCANLRSGPSYAVASAYQRWRDVGEQEAAELLAELRC